MKVVHILVVANLLLGMELAYADAAGWPWTRKPNQQKTQGLHQITNIHKQSSKNFHVSTRYKPAFTRSIGPARVRSTSSRQANLAKRSPKPNLMLPISVSPNRLIQYRVFVPKLTRFVTYQRFHYFKVHLIDIQQFFPRKITWNRNHDRARTIYADTKAGAALRAAYLANHKLIYSGRYGRGGNTAGILRKNSQSFFDLLEKNTDSPATSFFSRKSKTDVQELKIYTYVLMDDGLRFSRTSAKLVVNQISKHSIHSGVSSEVYYAGEFWVEFVSNQKTLFIDNNSGSFGPSKNDLFRMQRLMQANFPGMLIKVLDYQDPEWKRKRQKVKKVH